MTEGAQREQILSNGAEPTQIGDISIKPLWRVRGSISFPKVSSVRVQHVAVSSSVEHKATV